MKSIPFGAPQRWIRFFILLFVTYPAIGQVIYYHNFGTATISGHPYTVPATTLDSHLSGSTWSNSVGVWTSGNGATGEAIRMQSPNAATITLTFNVAANYKADIDSFSFWRQRSSNIAWNAWSMTINGISVGSGVFTGTTGANIGTTPVANPAVGLTGTITVVISLSGQTGNGTLRIDDFTLNGSVTPNCTAATITSVSPTTGPEHTLVTLTGTGFLAGAGTSAVKFNGTASVFTVVSDTEIRAYVPAGQVSGPITVVTNGCDGTPAQSFTSIVSVVGGVYSSDIYITEIYDAEAGDGGIIEIYNGTAAAVDLSNYTIRRYGDIGDTSSFYTIPLTGVIPPGGIFLVGIGNGPLPCPIAENMHYATGFNQNDEFELLNNGTVIDNVYAPVAGVGYSVIRNPDAEAPKPEFDPVDWTTYTTESCADIGLFTPSAVAVPTISPVNSQITCEQGSVTFSAPLSNPTGYTFQWKMLNASGAWVNVPATGPYSGATTTSLTINPTPLSLDNGQFYCAYTSSSTGTTLVSSAAQLDVNPATVVPTFTQVAPICQGDPLAALPTTSNNGITGSWSPAPNNATTTVYTFTPNAGQCATTTTMTITVNPGSVLPTFTQIAPICQGDPLAALPTTSNNGITGSWSPAPNNATTTVYTFTPNAGQCATTTTMTITVNPGSVLPTFTQVTPICQGDPLAALPTTSNNGITGSWSPAPNNATTTVYTFTPNAGQCATTTTMTITVNPGSVVPAFTQVAPICQGDPLAALPTTSNNGTTGSWSPAPNNAATTVYTFTPTAGQCATTTTMTITVNPGSVVPAFTQVAPICQSDPLAALPTTSNNGITGSWSPAPNNATTTVYTFTPNAGQCATTTTMTITVNPGSVLPTFTQVAPICQGDPLAALPTTSNNSITGSWSPAPNNASTTVYTFTPNAGQCATTTTMTITVNPGSALPTFTQVAPICQGDPLAALPTTSNNGITGSWSPAPNNAATTTYTFTPTTGQCATTATMTITVTPGVTPTFTQVAPICQGDPLAALPTTSNNGITGSWSPAPNNATTTVYTFTPNAGQCATTTTMTITVNPGSVLPTFTQVAPICQGDPLAALPTTSNNSITGSWSPAPNNATTTVYTFTPNAGQCATTTTMTITVNPGSVVPTFTQVAPICQGDPLAALPTTSSNGITGSWSPAPNNASTTTYTFTPTTGQCATTATMTITVTPTVTPTFTQVAPICQGDPLAALPTTANNGITGSWSPAPNSATTTVYTFTPTAGQCATTTTMTITVNPGSVLPTFTQVAPICQGDPLAALPTTSNNGITGSWSPAPNNASTTVYTFTPNAGQCATTTTMTITVNPGSVLPTFTQVAPICQGDPLAALPTTANNGIAGSWSPAPNNATTTVYTFTPNAGQCATTATMTITVNPGSVVPAFTQVAPICQGDPLSGFPTTSNNGITGSWSPGPNNATTTVYTFTPTAGQCATTATMTITVTPNVTPTFTQVAPICQGDPLAALPTTANNGITGSWSPAPNNATTTVYTFTPNAGQCATTTTMTITVTPNVTPTFTQVPPICQGDSLAVLPTTSNNGITGSWSPAPNNASTTVYTFTPNAGQCATTTTMTITVVNGIVPTFSPIGPVCYRESLSLPERSLEGIRGTWSPAPNNEATTTYTFTPDNGQCATPTTVTVVVLEPLPIELGGPYYLCVDNSDGTVISTVTLASRYDSSQFIIDWYKDGQLLAGHDSDLVVSEPGTYKLTITDPVSGCTRSALTQVYTSSIAIASATVGRDFNDSQFIEITVTGGSGDYEFLLEGGNAQDSNIFSNIYEGEYEVSVRDKHGCGQVNLLVYALNYPRYFTPNGDGIHDVWTINGLRNQTGCQIYIFDRYGKLLAATRPAHDNGWDGTYNGHSMPADDYWFTCDYLDRSGQSKQLKAHFSLKR